MSATIASLIIFMVASFISIASRSSGLSFDKSTPEESRAAMLLTVFVALPAWACIHASDPGLAACTTSCWWWISPLTALPLTVLPLTALPLTALPLAVPAWTFFSGADASAATVFGCTSDVAFVCGASTLSAPPFLSISLELLPFVAPACAPLEAVLRLLPFFVREPLLPLLPELVVRFDLTGFPLAVRAPRFLLGSVCE